MTLEAHTFEDFDPRYADCLRHFRTATARPDAATATPDALDRCVNLIENMFRGDPPGMQGLRAHVFMIFLEEKDPAAAAEIVEASQAWQERQLERLSNFLEARGAAESVPHESIESMLLRARESATQPGESPMNLMNPLEQGNKAIEDLASTVTLASWYVARDAAASAADALRAGAVALRHAGSTETAEEYEAIELELQRAREAAAARIDATLFPAERGIR